MSYTDLYVCLSCYATVLHAPLTLHITQYLPPPPPPPFLSYVADALDLDGRPWINQWLLQVENLQTLSRFLQRQ